MKNQKLINLFLIALVVVFSSCKKDDDTTNPVDQTGEDVVQTSEDDPLELSKLDKAIVISDSEKKNDAFPKAKGELDLNILFNRHQAILKDGFNIYFSSKSTKLAGARIRFRELNGESSKTYFEVPASVFYITPLVATQMQGYYTIDVDFNDKMTPGDFCYDMSLFDTDGNVSNIENICAKVEEWGGKNDIIGDWVYVKTEPANPKTKTMYCKSGDTLQVAGKFIESRIGGLTLKNDGSLVETKNYSFKLLDEALTKENCTAEYKVSQQVKETFTGKWLFNNVDSTFTAVNYTYKDAVTGYEEEYPKGDISYDRSRIEIKNNELHIYEYQDVGPIDILVKTIFKKK